MVFSRPLPWNVFGRGTADVQHERNAAFLEQLPERMIVGMGRRQVARGHRGHRGHQNRTTTRLDGSGRFLYRASRIAPEDAADTDHAIVIRAESAHGPVQRAGAAVQEIRVLAHELGRGEGGKDQLLVEAEQVEGAAPLSRVECSECAPTLRSHHVRFEFGRLGRVSLASRRLRDRLLGELSRSAQVERADLLTDARIGLVGDPFGQFHDVAVGIVESTTLGVRHVGSSGKQSSGAAEESGK